MCNVFLNKSEIAYIDYIVEADKAKMTNSPISDLFEQEIKEATSILKKLRDEEDENGEDLE